MSRCPGRGRHQRLMRGAFSPAALRRRSQAGGEGGGELCPSASRQLQLPSAVPGRFMRASLPRPSTSCAGITASAARRAAIRSATMGLRGIEAGGRPRVRVEGVPPAAGGLGVVRAGVDDEPLGRGSRGGADCAPPPKPNSSTTMPGRPSFRRSRSTGGVITPRSSAISCSAPSSRRAASNTARRARAASAPPARAARARAPTSRRRSRGSDRCGRGRTAGPHGAGARSTSGTRCAAAQASRRADCPRADRSR